MKGKEKSAIEIEKKSEEGNTDPKPEENAEQSAWNLKEEGFDDI